MIPKIDRHTTAYTLHTHISSITLCCVMTRPKCSNVCVVYVRVLCAHAHSQIKSNTFLYRITPDVWRCNAYSTWNFYLTWTGWTRMFFFVFLLLSPDIFSILFLGCLSQFGFYFMFVYVYFNNTKTHWKSIEMSVIQWDFKGWALAYRDRSTANTKRLLVLLSH